MTSNKLTEEPSKKTLGNSDTLEERLEKFKDEDSVSYEELVEKHA